MSTEAEIVGSGPFDGVRITLHTDRPVHGIALFARQPDGRVAATMTALRDNPLTADEILAGLAGIAEPLMEDDQA